MSGLSSDALSKLRELRSALGDAPGGAVVAAAGSRDAAVAAATRPAAASAPASTPSGFVSPYAKRRRGRSEYFIIVEALASGDGDETVLLQRLDSLSQRRAQELAAFVLGGGRLSRFGEREAA